ncbi:hypothetical protein CLAFUW4_05719 [Fulvia fulva]|uniref:Uncharacterized protein n=1 Tax=Passalora fulva TaxID=5499 RepID=A0A9Q8P8Y5_PASFU|nr:uncharacterized protein CLAFUR5_05862 [Fulvia fulva]KAK4624746.1 hypothetical protein CLAFUR4_05713 [Fulvia fulva]KAK4625537.1 hypothetical protein CLAFUR0_05724 [Fulvia fulva]UJO17699.1 hypothetical protein CLAFUR5_05862 [Fulvia fulva]WPV15027.1 hypothetical protein CLAFUW4_05719 [Fulvia fulva]WPV29944.1 hypothetical protein CLAFUW7_05717 [Fulvia fulva]
MCYATMITWQKCGHWRTINEMCEEALEREPPTFCTSAFEPIAIDVDRDDGVCPDLNKHPLAPGEVRAPCAWSVRLGGDTRTAGRGNQWYSQQSQGQG